MSILYKDPAEIRAFVMDFSAFSEIVGGDTINTVVSLTISPAGPTLGPTSISGGQVKFTITGGTSGTNYTVTCQVTTLTGATLKGIGTLIVIPTQG